MDTKTFRHSKRERDETNKDETNKTNQNRSVKV